MLDGLSLFACFRWRCTLVLLILTNLYTSIMDVMPGPSWLRGKLLVGAITTVCSSAFLLFGYDQGVMSGVDISEYWLQQMGHPSTLMLSTITALYDVGAFFGAIFAACFAERLGRRRTMILGSAIVIIGTILMGSCYERIQMMVGRVVTGIGAFFVKSVPATGRT